MAEIRVPTLGESVTEATVGKWFKQPGDAVAVDEPLVELETDKVTLEVPAPAAGVLGEITRQDGRDGRGRRACSARSRKARRRRRNRPHRARRRAGPTSRQADHDADQRRGRRAAASRSPPRPARANTDTAAVGAARWPRKPASIRPSVQGSGKHGQVTKGDMMAAIERAAALPTPVLSRAGADARAVARRRRFARRARADDAAAPDHRAPPQGRAEHRGDAHDLQRGRHERGDGDAQPTTRSCSRRSTA